jgi:hypothetical protein
MRVCVRQNVKEVEAMDGVDLPSVISGGLATH